MSTALRGLQMLEALAGMRQPAPLRAVAERVGLSQSQTFRVLQELERGGYLEHLGRSGYRLAGRSVALATLIGPRPAVLRAVHPAVSRLAHITGEAVVVHLRSGSARVLVLGVPAPSGPIAEPAGVLGERSPLAVGSSGRIILAYLPERELASIDLVGTTPAQLAAIRERGYETSFGENHPGVNGVSAPLLAYRDENVPEEPTTLGAITVAGPASRLTEAAFPRVLKPLLAACRDLSPRLAAVLGPYPGETVDQLDL
ncbi:IclR family transcriptional regulator [Streptacidiphilus anmyonensis]|uniref:IclR family transcriptional regulator n=1 Tax=Streptacidiphilus anmyonensis TaxID=405782 RepID=UPI00191C34C5|nr:helix-turn-helix domain-containing protein [Streptacidiphilus anmyonensis]